MKKVFTPKGTHFGKWTTLEDCTGIGNRKVLCRCECSLEKPVYIKHLINGKSKSCISCAIRTTSSIEETKIGRWEIIKEVPAKRGRKYLCRCQCGAEEVVSHAALTKGTAKGCKSCSRREDLDIIGAHFGDWEVLHDIYGTSPHRVWCRCRCGKEQGVLLANLQHGKTHGCQSCAGKKRFAADAADRIPLRDEITQLSEKGIDPNQGQTG